MEKTWTEFPTFADDGVYDVRLTSGCIDQGLMPRAKIHIRTGVVVQQWDIPSGDRMVVHEMVGLDVIELRLQATAYNDFQHDKPGSPAMQFRLVA